LTSPEKETRRWLAKQQNNSQPLDRTSSQTTHNDQLPPTLEQKNQSPTAQKKKRKKLTTALVLRNNHKPQTKPCPDYSFSLDLTPTSTTDGFI
jgi:hypothetical protein